MVWMVVGTTRAVLKCRKETDEGVPGMDLMIRRASHEEPEPEPGPGPREQGEQLMKAAMIGLTSWASGMTMDDSALPVPALFD